TARPRAGTPTSRVTCTKRTASTTTGASIRSGWTSDRLAPSLVSDLQRSRNRVAFAQLCPRLSRDGLARPEPLAVMRVLPGLGRACCRASGAHPASSDLMHPCAMAPVRTRLGGRLYKSQARVLRKINTLAHAASRPASGSTGFAIFCGCERHADGGNLLLTWAVWPA